jgi:hypothetical protein
MKVVVMNEELYNAKVREVELDLSKMSNSFRGDVSIETDEGWKTFSGEHGADDYLEDYGFVIAYEIEIPKVLLLDISMQSINN